MTNMFYFFYRFMLMSIASETNVASTTPNFEMSNFGTKSLYDLMETNEQMV